MASDRDRHSRPVGSPPKQVLGDENRARQEVENGFRQHDRLIQLIDAGLVEGHFRLRRSAIEELNRLAVDGLVDHPGGLRPFDIEITKSHHKPPAPANLSRLLDELCEYVNDNWSKSAQYLAAYVMWRLNWIHPFEDGNGRTTRAVSYLVLCIHLRRHLPGSKTLPERIVDRKEDYYRALEDADGSELRGVLDLSNMETLLHDLVMAQVADALGDESRSSRPISPNNGSSTELAAGRVGSEAGFIRANVDELKKGPSRIIITVISGVVLAFALFFLSQRGCSVTRSSAITGGGSSSIDAHGH